MNNFNFKYIVDFYFINTTILKIEVSSKDRTPLWTFHVVYYLKIFNDQSWIIKMCKVFLNTNQPLSLIKSDVYQ
jgi:hypothetical protein